MQKIMHLISSLDVGGTELFLCRLLSFLSRDRFGCEVTSLVEPGLVGARIRDLGIPVRSLGLRRGEVRASGLLKLVRWLRQDPPDVLVTWLYHADLLGLVAAKMAGISQVIWNIRAADMDMSGYRALSGWTRGLCRLLSRYPRAIVVNSERGRSFHVRIGFRPREWVLIRNGVDPKIFKPDSTARDEVRRELNLAPEDLLIGLVARYDPMKDHANFISAAAQLAAIQKTVHFALIGKGMDPLTGPLAAALNRPPLVGRVHLLGEREDVPRLTAAFDIACSASRSEAFPNTVAEAMSCGIICVTTDAGDAAQILGEHGIVVPCRRPDELARGLGRAVAMNREERTRIGGAARERVLQNFTMEDSVQQYERFFVRVGR
jgi:glycosyltransferase involved in cell wall biosynthesis